MQLPIPSITKQKEIVAEYNVIQNRFPKEKVVALIQTYQIGTSKQWQGATIFWQKDVNHNIRTGKRLQAIP